MTCIEYLTYRIFSYSLKYYMLVCHGQIWKKQALLAHIVAQFVE